MHMHTLLGHASPRLVLSYKANTHPKDPLRPLGCIADTRYFTHGLTRIHTLLPGLASERSLSNSPAH